MHRSLALHGGPKFPVRSALSLIALIATVLIGAHVVFAAGGSLSHSHVPPGLSAALAGPQAPPVHQSLSAACFRSAPAVTAVRTNQNDVLVRFAGQVGFMKIQYLASEDAAIRYAYAHGTISNFYDNTNWFNTPAHLTRGALHALGGCLTGKREG